MNREPDWALWRSFAGVVEHGSLSGAARALGLSQPTVSHHLRVLVSAGFLEREKRGTWAYFRLADGAIDAIAELLGR